MLENTQPCGFAAVCTAILGLTFSDTIFGVKRLVGLDRQSISHAGQGSLLPDVDLVP
jgi:hypothetical protein